MLSTGFERAFRSLVSAFKRYHDVPRTPDNVPELGQARMLLDDARDEIRRKRPASAQPTSRPHLFKADVAAADLTRLHLQAIRSG